MIYLKKIKKNKNTDFIKEKSELKITNFINLNNLLLIISNNNIKKINNKILNIKENYIRSVAELENLKKRSSEEINKTYKYAIEDFSENLLNVLDSLEAALYNKSNNIEKLIEGIRLTLQILLNILKKNNITSIMPEKYDQFDPYKHLAISIIKNNDKKDNTIETVLQKGYFIFERLLRPALVVVNKV